MGPSGLIRVWGLVSALCKGSMWISSYRCTLSCTGERNRGTAKGRVPAPTTRMTECWCGDAWLIAHWGIMWQVLPEVLSCEEPYLLINILSEHAYHILERACTLFSIIVRQYPAAGRASASTPSEDTTESNASPWASASTDLEQL